MDLEAYCGIFGRLLKYFRPFFSKTIWMDVILEIETPKLMHAREALIFWPKIIC
jgi:hypothetical protein